MKFGPIPVADAEGAILAHSEIAADPVNPASLTYKIPKGTVLTAQHLADLAAYGLTEIVVARLDRDDVHEDEAAMRLAQALIRRRGGLEAGAAAKGRVNLRAAHAGIVELDAQAIDRVNRIDPGITIATVRPWHKLGPGGLAATIKIIPYAAPQALIAQACAAAEGAMHLRAANLASASLIETRIGAAMPSDKGRGAIAGRIGHFGAQLSDRIVVDHQEVAVARALSDAPGELLMILTGSATSDRADVAPAALRRAGGTLLHYGMPVDPGNLLFVGRLGGKPVIGLPGCARSPALNGADWVMERVICGVPPEEIDIPGMGVGGLLKEIPSRPQPRDKIG